MNDDVSFHLLNLVQMLKLIGVTPALTGIRPDLAMKAVQLNLNLSNVMIGGNLEEILHRIGFTLNRNGS
jgi:rsbT co-antagonist protein RsbR